MLQAVRNLIIALMVTFGMGSVHAATEPGLIQALAQWVSASTKNQVSQEVATRYVKEAFSAARKWGVDPLLLLSVMKAESNYQAKAGNKYGARGLMQIVPRFHKDKVNKQSVLDYRTNIQAGAQIIDEYLELHGENFHKAMNRYSGGAGRAYKAKIKDSYQELRDVTLAWKLANDSPIVAEHRFTQPRRYAKSVSEYEQAALAKAQPAGGGGTGVQIALIQHDVLDAYIQAMTR